MYNALQQHNPRLNIKMITGRPGQVKLHETLDNLKSYIGILNGDEVKTEASRLAREGDYAVYYSIPNRSYCYLYKHSSGVLTGLLPISNPNLMKTAEDIERIVVNAIKKKCNIEETKKSVNSMSILGNSNSNNHSSVKQNNEAQVITDIAKIITKDYFDEYKKHATKTTKVNEMKTLDIHQIAIGVIDRMSSYKDSVKSLSGITAQEIEDYLKNNQHCSNDIWSYFDNDFEAYDYIIIQWMFTRVTKNLSAVESFLSDFHDIVSRQAFLSGVMAFFRHYEQFQKISIDVYNRVNNAYQLAQSRAGNNVSQNNNFGSS